MQLKVLSSRLPAILAMATWLSGPLLMEVAGETPGGSRSELPASSQAEFTEFLEVRLVEVEAAVTDKKGRPVVGLTRDDFEVTIDGLPVEISHFSGAVSPHRSGERPLPEQSEVVASAKSPLHLVLYIDSTSVEQGRRNNVIGDIRQFLNRDLGPQDQVMLVSADRSSFQLHQTLTSDRGSIESELDRIAKTAAQDRRASEFGEILHEIESFASASLGYGESSTRARATSILARIGAYSAETGQTMLRITENLRRIVDALAGVPGTKVILYVGGGISLNPGGGLVAALNNVLGMRGGGSSPRDRPPDTPVGGLGNTGTVLRALAQHASVQGVRLCAIDPSGQLGTIAVRASRGSIEAGAGASATREDTWAPGLDFSQRIELRSSLQLLASETGGTALVTGRDYEGFLRRLTGGLDGTYSLGVRLSPAATGEIHRIEVSAKRKGLQVRHRRSFRRQDGDQEAAYRTLSALLVGVSENRLGVRLEAGEQELVRRGTYLVPVSIELPLTELAVTAREDTHAGQLSIFVTSGDGELTSGPVRKMVFPFALPNDQILSAMGQMLQHWLELELPEGPTRIAVGVRDDLDPVLATATLELVVGEAEVDP